MIRDALRRAASLDLSSRFFSCSVAASSGSSSSKQAHSLQDFIREAAARAPVANDDFARTSSDCSPSYAGQPAPRGGTVFMETYGCQMNVSDSEVVVSILDAAGFSQVSDPAAADVVLLNTCAIRDNAERRIWGRLGHFKGLKRARAAAPSGGGPVVGLLGCMAERLKHQLLDTDRLVDLVAGPDAYRDLPRLINIVRGDAASQAINVQLSQDETYADLRSTRPAGSHAAFLSIMRGCANMCSFCIVPFTRGRERSRPMASVLDEIRLMRDQGVKEITLLGQNVNSYADTSARDPVLAAARPPPGEEDPFGAYYARGFRSVYKPTSRQGAVDFAELLAAAAAAAPDVRFRFTSPHPKDFSDRVLAVIRDAPNVCKQLHMPAQSGSTAALQRMRRGYSRAAYDDLVQHVRETIPGVALSTDIIVGFCGESQQEHEATLDLMHTHAFEQAYMFAYSSRDRTHAQRHYLDDVPAEVKAVRLQEVMAAFKAGQAQRTAAELGATHLVLLEGLAKGGGGRLVGRTDTMKRVEIPGDGFVPSAPAGLDGVPGAGLVQLHAGDYVAVRVIGSHNSTLRGVPLARSSIAEYAAVHGSEHSSHI